MHLSELYQEFGNIIDTAALLFGGGAVVRVYYWIKGSGKREASVDSHIESLRKTANDLRKSINKQQDKLGELRELAQENAIQQGKLRSEINNLQRFAEDTKENTKAVQELSTQISRLIDQVEKDPEN